MLANGGSIWDRGVNNVEKLIEYLTNKITKVIMVFIGIVVPGILTLFIFKRSIFIEIDIFKQLLLSFAIGIPTYCLITVSYIIQEMIRYGSSKILKKEEYILDFDTMFIFPLILNFIFFCGTICYHVWEDNYDARMFSIHLVGVCLVISLTNLAGHITGIIIKIIISLTKGLYFKIKQRKTLHQNKNTSHSKTQNN